MRHLIVGLAFALGATLLTWIVIGNDTTTQAEFWIAVNVVPMIIGGIISNDHAGPSEVVFYILQFIQWFIVGFMLSRGFSKVFRKR